jgi:hypothetical protein
MLAMVADHFIAARVSSETKARLKALADQRQVSESAVLKQLLELTLDSGVGSRIRPAESAPHVTRAARLYVRLHPDDQLLLAERAAGRRMAAATYVAVLVRAHLRHLSPLPKDELLALKQSIAELGVIGRNLNHIARAVQQGGAASGPRREDVMAMLKVCMALRDHFKATLLANLRSWEVGHESDRS